MEVLAHLDERERLALTKWFHIPVRIPLELIEIPTHAPDSWRKTPYPPETQSFGAEWARARRSAVLRVPSAVVPGEFNYLLNPAHPGFARIKTGKPEPFHFDARLA